MLSANGAGSLSGIVSCGHNVMRAFAICFAVLVFGALLVSLSRPSVSLSGPGGTYGFEEFPTVSIYTGLPCIETKFSFGPLHYYVQCRAGVALPVLMALVASIFGVSFWLIGPLRKSDRPPSS
jgi:hypothetical protein